MEEETLDNLGQTNPDAGESADSGSVELSGLSDLYKDWFLDYASYVILERAVPDLRDGLKPVQRRILHSMKEMDDGRYNKVANIIGNTMKYHPHGDASIRDALVQLGQKDLLIDMQGNWGNILTGDPAAAPRYIEARLSKFALEVVFNPKTTNWLLSYDGRNKEPEVLPVKFPLLLAQGVEGIAVGLASKILPHNFNELIDASVKYLRGRSFELYPDFLTGGMADVSKYNDGLRGGKVRVRARITKADKKTLIITEIPFSTTTSSLIDSIISANEKGKIKIKKIEDNTAENVEIKITLGSGVSPDQTIDALYAFTNCEISISPNACVIDDDKPKFLGVKEMLKISADHTVRLLKMELEIRRGELMEQWHFASLEKIFIRERIYRQIEEAESWEETLELIDKGLEPYKSLFKREITRDDIVRLTEIKIKRISKYNEFKADERIKELEEQIKEIEYHLAHLIDYAVDYYKNIKKKYGAGHERRTELRSFENIDAASVAVSNVKLYANREEGFIGTGLKKDEFLFECSDIDDIIVFRKNGTFIVTKLADKVFVGKEIIHVGVFNKNDDRTIYNMIYRDGKTGPSYAKRFAITSITRDKVYHLTKGKPDSKVLYFTANPNGEAELVRVKLRPRAKIRKLLFDFDFSNLAIKGRNAKGNLVTKNPVSSVVLKEGGVSTLGARDIWFDDSVKRLNADERGVYLGAFGPEDKILIILSSGEYMLTGFDLSTHFHEEMIKICKYDPEAVWSVVYFDGNTGSYYLKRFKMENVSKKVSFISEHSKSKMLYISKSDEVSFDIIFDKRKNPKLKDKEVVAAADFIDIKGYKARGKRLTANPVKKIVMNEPETEELSPVVAETKEEIKISEKEADVAVAEETVKPEAGGGDKASESATGGEDADEKLKAKPGKEVAEAGFKPGNDDKKQEKKKPSVEKSVDNTEEKVSSKPVEKTVDGDAKKKAAKDGKSGGKKAVSRKSGKEGKGKETVNKEVKPVDNESVEPVLPLDVEDVPPPKEKPAKKKRPSKKKAADSSKKKVSLDSDEPLQMELDF